MSDTRAQLKTLVTNGVLTGGRRTVAATLRDILNAIIDACSNIQDNGNIAGGFPILDGSGKVALAQLPALGGGITRVTKTITGLTNIDLTGLSGIVMISLQSASVTFETINSFTNFSDVDIVYLYPKNTFDININDTSIGSGNIRCAGSTMTCYGAGEGFIQLTKTNNIFYQTQYQDQYV